MVTISDIISNQNVALIHCQSTLNGGSIITEIYYMNGKTVKSVDVNNFQIRPHTYQKLIDFFSQQLQKSQLFRRKTPPREPLIFAASVLERENPNQTTVEEKFGLALIRMKVKLHSCKYVGTVTFKLMCSSIYLSEQSCICLQNQGLNLQNSFCFCATKFHMKSWLLVMI